MAYKIFKLKSNSEIESIIVFYGNTYGDSQYDFNEIYKKNKNSLKINEFFSEIEWNVINQQNIPIYFSELQIHIDDTLLDVKLKILKAYNELGLSFSEEEIYLFGEIKKKLLAIHIYDTLTLNRKKFITKSKLKQFLSNIILNESREPIRFEIPDKPENEFYDYDDIIALNVDNQYFYVNTALGINTTISNVDYFFTVNPFSEIINDELEEKRIVHYSNSDLLMNNGEISDNRIYLCCAQDVLNGNPFVSKIYFNELYKKDVFSIDQLSREWVNRSLEMFSAFDNKYKKIDLFYDIEKYKNMKKKELHFNYGIKSVRLSILPSSVVKLPLEVIFKIIHATLENPFIKFNPEKGRENIYRIYCNKLSKDGRKIPFVPIGEKDTNTKANINTLKNVLGKRQSVSIFINNEESKFSSCEFFENGNIQIYCEFKTITDIDTIETYIRNHINPILDEAKIYMEQNGYNIQLFNSFSEENIIINGIDFQSNSIVKKTLQKLNLSPIINYITPIFIVDNPQGSVINMRFKRVNNFNNVTSQEAFILDFYNFYEGDFQSAKEELIQLLMLNYNLTIEQATQLEMNYTRKLEALQQQKIIKRGPRKNINPGFKVQMNLFDLNKINLTIENIDNILYLNIIPIYIEGLIKLLLRTDIPIIIPTELNVIDEPDTLIEAIVQEEQEQEVAVEEEEEEMDNYDLDEDIEGMFDGGEPNSDSDKSAELSSLSITPPSDESLPIDSDDKSIEKQASQDLQEELNNLSNDIISYIVPTEENVNTNKVETPSQDLPVDTNDKSVDIQESPTIEESPVIEESPDIKESPVIEESPDLSSLSITPSSDESLPVNSDENILDNNSFNQSIFERNPNIPLDELNYRVPTSDTPPPDLVPYTSDYEDLSDDLKEKYKDVLLPSLKKHQSKINVLQEESSKLIEALETKMDKLIKTNIELKSSDNSSEDVEKQLTQIDDDINSTQEKINSLQSLNSNLSLQLTEIKDKQKEIQKKLSIKEDKEEEEEKEDKEDKEDKEEEEKEEEDKEEEEQEEEEEEEEIQEIINWEGKSLTHPNPFQEKMEKNDPLIFAKDIKKGYKAYSKSCPSNQKRQPVLVTKSEMNNILKEIPDYLSKGLEDGTILEYGSNPQKTNYYICPRFWCLRTWSPIITEMQKEQCGDINDPNAIIGNKDRIVPKGKFIVEFNNKGKLYPFPGFINNKDNDNELCVPCCFSKIGDKHTSVKKMCLDKVNKLVSGKNESKVFESEEEEEKEEENKKYNLNGIKNPTFFPLYDGEYGHLPIVLKKFLQHKESGCNEYYTTNLNKIETNKECILRVGVEKSNTQSFIACISKNYSYSNKLEKELSIQEFKELLIQNFLTIDKFIIFQNGDLPTLFKPSIINEDISIEEYTTSNIYSKINDKNMNYFIQLVNSFENFKNYLRDPNVEIDYTYLWDIICDNNGLFKGVNLVILKIPFDDPTSNVEIICPTNHYSKSLYNPNKPTMIIYTQSIKDNIYNYYEPIYTIKNNESKKIIITPFFYIRNPSLSPSIKRILTKVIYPLMSNRCKPISNMREYTFKHSLQLNEIISLLIKNNYEILLQVVNYMSQVILIQVQKKLTKLKRVIKGVIPCFPSSLMNTYPYTFMDDESIYESYQDTKFFLRNVNKEIRQIHCKPIFKVVEDENIIGIITDTNQFVMVKHEVNFGEDDIGIIEEGNLLLTDANILVNNKKDSEREDSVKMIKLESLFYNVFRNTIRILMNKYENLKLREIVEKLTKDKFIVYKEKYNTIIDILKQLGKDKITFTDIDPQEYVQFLDNYSTCATMEEKSCLSNNPLCSYTKNTCQLILPKIGAISNDNETLFYGKMSDELIRYSRINSYIFKPNAYLSFGTLNYNLRENEMIITDFGLKDYFNNLISVESNQYVKYNTYDTVVSNLVENTELIKLSELKDPIITCSIINNSKINISYWKDCIIPEINVNKYPNSVLCGYEVIKKIINNTKISNYDIKTILAELYNKYLLINAKHVLDILENEGKKYFSDEMKIGNMNIYDVIFSEHYFITLFDIWLIVEKYQIPIIILSQKLLFNKKHVITLYGEESDNFIFLITTPSRNDHVINFQILYNSVTNNLILPLDIISCPNKKREILYTIENKKSITEYLEVFTPRNKTKYIKKLSEQFELIGDEEEEIKIKKPRTKKLLDEEFIIVNPKKPRKPRTKKLLDEEFIIVNPKKTRKPRTKKNKLEGELVFVDEI